MLQEYIEKIADPREQHKIKYNLHEIIIMTICAVVSGCEAWYEVVHYCQAKQKCCREKSGLSLSNGIPSHDIFERVFALVNPKEFERCFASWTSSVQQVSKGEIVSIDGKTLRASASQGQCAVHMVSAWANKNRLVLGQVKTNEKSNEITAIPELLEMLDLHGCVVTIDAMGCQKDIGHRIAEQGADYVLGLKGNQPSLMEAAEQYGNSI